LSRSSRRRDSRFSRGCRGACQMMPLIAQDLPVPGQGSTSPRRRGWSAGNVHRRRRGRGRSSALQRVAQGQQDFSSRIWSGWGAERACLDRVSNGTRKCEPTPAPTFPAIVRALAYVHEYADRTWEGRSTAERPFRERPDRRPGRGEQERDELAEAAGSTDLPRRLPRLAATSGALSAQPDAPVVPDPPARTAKWRALVCYVRDCDLRPRPAGRQEPACGAAQRCRCAVAARGLTGRRCASRRCRPRSLPEVGATRTLGEGGA